MKNVNYNPKLKGFARANRKQGTKAEAILWKYVLSKKQLKGLTFNRQFASGDFLFDFICRKAKLIIEVDGLTHQFERVIEKDIQKEQYIKELGFNLIRIDDNEVYQNLDRVHKMLENHLEQKGF